MSKLVAIIENNKVVNIITYDDDSFGRETLKDNQVEVTNKQINIGFLYNGNDFLEPSLTAEQQQFILDLEAKAEARSIAEAKLLELGLTTEDLKALLG